MVETYLTTALLALVAALAVATRVHGKRGAPPRTLPYKEKWISFAGATEELGVGIWPASKGVETVAAKRMRPGDGTAEPAHVGHKEWNKLMHITHGNTSAASFELMSMNVAGMMVPLQGGADDSTPGSLAKVDLVEAFLAMRRRPALVALQECAGGWAELQILADRLRKMGYDSVFEPGEAVESGHDRHRRGGVLLGWQLGEFRVAEGAPRTIDGVETQWARGKRFVALVQESYLDEAEEAGEMAAPVAKEMRKYAGKRALAARLVRRKGPMANAERIHAVAYVPASASDTVKAAFIGAVSAGIERVAADGTPFTLAGDWQASPSPLWRVHQRANKAHEVALADAFFEGRGGVQDDAATVGAVVPMKLQAHKGEYSHHSAQGWHATIDHVFTDHQSLARTRGVDSTPPFLGSLSEGHDEHALFDHRTLVVRIEEGSVTTLGRQRPRAERLRRNAAEIREYLKRLPTEADLEDDDDVALGKLESQIAATASEVRRRFMSRQDVGRRQAPDSEEVQLKYLRGLYDLVMQAYSECSESWGRSLFGACDANHLYHDSMLRKARDRQIQRAGRRRIWALDWRVMRDACEHALRNAISRLEPRVRQARHETAQAADLGIGAAHSAESFARLVQEKQRAIKRGARAAGFSLTALKNAQGAVVNTPEEVHKVAHEYGVAQNRESRCDEGLMKGWMDAFVPKGDTLTLPNGERWTWRKAVTYPVFCREMRRARPGKAVALHPFLVDHLQCVPDDHPTLKLYYELFVRCLEAGRFPAHYRELVACFIPKTYGDVFELGCLRDIWLINHGSKLAERFLLHTAIAPMNSSVLLCHAGGCKGRGCVDQAFALHAAIADAHATKRNIFVLYVDLIKCFMSFSREAGRGAAAHAGLPQSVVRAMRGLVDCAVHGTATGQYLTAFGTTDPFAILRGFLQGALASPEMCKLMMNTLAEALEMKIVGYEMYDPSGRGEWLTQLIFVDDAANITVSAAMMQRVALFWSVWLRITDTQANIAKLKKTVMSGMIWRTRKDGSKVAQTSTAEVYVGGLNPGEAPRRVPCLKISEKYAYVGMPTRLDGAHNQQGLALVKSKVNNGAIQASSRPASRCAAIATANCYTMGSAFFYGSVFGGTVSLVEQVLGPVARRACRSGMVRGKRRAPSAPAVQLHAPPKPMAERKNDPMSVRAARMGQGLAGYGVAHPYPPMAASAAMTFLNNLGAPLPTPSNLAALSSLARVLHEFGCRATPADFDFANLMDVLDQSNVIERAVWLICRLNGGRLLLEANFREGCAMHDARWPGYPCGWVDLWKGQLWLRLRRASPSLEVSRVLMRAGVSELANICTRDGAAFASWHLLQQMAPHVLEEAPFQARRDFAALKDALVAAGVGPVRGRQPWAAVDAMENLRPSMDAPGVADDGGTLWEDAQAREERETRVEMALSGDGGRALARLVGLDGRPEWEEEAEEGGAAGGGGGEEEEEPEGRGGDRVHARWRSESSETGERCTGGDGDRVHSPGAQVGRGEGGARPREARPDVQGVLPFGARVAIEVYGESAALPVRFPLAPFGFAMEEMAVGGSWRGIREATEAAIAVSPMRRVGAPHRVGERDLSLAERVLRATDAFGVLDVALDAKGGPPSDAEVGRAFEEVRDGLHHQAEADRAIGGELEDSTRCATACVNAALVALADRESRAVAFDEALNRAKSTVLEVRCPIDVRGLQSFAAGGERRRVVHRDSGLTLGEIAEELVTLVGAADGDGVAWIDLAYRHSFVGARLIAAGHVACSRVYAMGKLDPFARPREVRAAALARFGFDFDDKSAYPTIMAAIFMRGRGASVRYLEHKGEVMRSLATYFFGAVGADRGGEVKQLFNAMDMGGAPGAWVEERRSSMVGTASVEGAVVEVEGGETVSVLEYRAAQKARAEELMERAPRLVAAVRRLNDKRGSGKRGELTAMSYLLQHYEGVSREAKSGWLADRGCTVFSLQHDGLMAALARGVSPERAAAGMGAAASLAAGYAVTVEVKSSPSGFGSSVFGDRPPCRPKPSHPPGEGVDEGERGEEEEGDEEAAAAFAKAVGASRKRQAPRLSLPGPDQLTVDGGTRRVVLSYKKDVPVEQRTWTHRTVGGCHEEWQGRGAEWLEWARQAYVMTGDGQLVGNRAHVQCPLAAAFWWECDAIARRAGKEINGAEARFVFHKLLETEASYPVSHFVASDGSRKEGDKENPVTRIGRAAFCVSRQGVRILGGRMETETRGFDRHSYEAEMEAFMDHLADTSDTVTVFITDCLSGSLAGSKFKSRTDAHKGGCYRGVELDNIDALEARHRAVIYMWVHSHVGITPNEAADVLADIKRDGEEWNEMAVAPSRFQLARVRGLKRGVGQAVYEMAQGLLLSELAARVQFTLLPGKGTWALAVKAPHKAKLLKEADFSLLADARANRCGLMADRSLDDPAAQLPPETEEEAWRRREYRPSRSSWEWFRQAVCACPGCQPRVDPEGHCAGMYPISGGCSTRATPAGRGSRGAGMYPISGAGSRARVTQTRWHTLVECGRGEEEGVMDALREKASAWLVGRAKGLDSDAAVALRALQGGGADLSRGQRWVALRFMLGVPMAPPDEEDAKDLHLAAGYARGFLVHMCALLREGARKAERAMWGLGPGFQTTLFARFGRGAVLLNRRAVRQVEGPDGSPRWVQGGRASWLRGRGLREQWESREWTRKAVSAWWLWTIKAGPAAHHRRVEERRQLEARRRVRLTEGREGAAPGEGYAAFDGWTQLSALRAWRRAVASGRGPGLSGGELALWAKEEGGARRRLVRLRAAGLDPNPGRDRQVAAEEKEVGREVEAVVARLVACVERGSLPMLRRVGEEAATRMGRRDLEDQLAEQGRAPLRGGHFAVERVLDVRRTRGRGVQALIRWKGGHDDEWRPLASCNALTKREAQVLVKRKFPPKRTECWEERARGTRDRAHLRRGGPSGSPAVAGPRRVLRGGAAPRFGTPAGFPAYSPGLAHQPGPYGAGAGRSARGLPILWESPSAEDLRGRLWQLSPGAVGAAGARAKRKGSGLADEGLAKRRQEGT